MTTATAFRALLEMAGVAVLLAAALRPLLFRITDEGDDR